MFAYTPSSNALPDRVARLIAEITAAQMQEIMANGMAIVIDAREDAASPQIFWSENAMAIQAYFMRRASMRQPPVLATAMVAAVFVRITDTEQVVLGVIDADGTLSVQPFHLGLLRRFRQAIFRDDA